MPADTSTLRIRSTNPEDDLTLKPLHSSISHRKLRIYNIADLLRIFFLCALAYN